MDFNLVGMGFIHLPVARFRSPLPPPPSSPSTNLRPASLPVLTALPSVSTGSEEVRDGNAWVQISKALDYPFATPAVGHDDNNTRVDNHGIDADGLLPERLPDSNDEEIGMRLQHQQQQLQHQPHRYKEHQQTEQQQQQHQEVARDWFHERLYYRRAVPVGWTWDPDEDDGGVRGREGGRDDSGVGLMPGGALGQWGRAGREGPMRQSVCELEADAVVQGEGLRPF